MIQTVTDTVVSEAEQDGQSVVTSLDNVQPPDSASIELRDAADQVLQTASNELSDLRIAVRRRDHAAMRKTLADLEQTLEKVQKLQDSTRSGCCSWAWASSPRSVASSTSATS
jgi:hypothetical protein